MVLEKEPDMAKILDEGIQNIVYTKTSSESVNKQTPSESVNNAYTAAIGIGIAVLKCPDPIKQKIDSTDNGSSKTIKTINARTIDALVDMRNSYDMFQDKNPAEALGAINNALRNLYVIAKELDAHRRPYAPPLRGQVQKAEYAVSEISDISAVQPEKLDAGLITGRTSILTLYDALTKYGS